MSVPFFPSPPGDLSNKVCHPFLLTRLCLKLLNSSAFSLMHIFHQLECIQACSHFVRGVLGWEKESSNCLRFGQNSFKLAQFISQRHDGQVKILNSNASICLQRAQTPACISEPHRLINLSFCFKNLNLCPFI